MATYKISSSGETMWLDCNAKTLRGAKMIASRTFQRSVGGKIMVGEVFNEGTEVESVVPVAVSYGFDGWTNF